MREKSTGILSMSCTTSLDDTFVEDGTPLMEIVPTPEPDKQQQEDELTDEIRMGKIEKVMQWLYPIDQEAVRLRYGVGTGQPMFYPAIGKALGFSRSRAQQRVDRAMVRLKLLASDPELQSA
jgi:DNA-directed RNA polymerase sigma subunit (sigma70/sigma32)